MHTSLFKQLLADANCCAQIVESDVSAIAAPTCLPHWHEDHFPCTDADVDAFFFVSM